MALSLSYSSSAAFTVVACPARSPPPRRLPSAVCFIRAVDTAPRAPLPCASSTYPPQPFVPENAGVGSHVKPSLSEAHCFLINICHLLAAYFVSGADLIAGSLIKNPGGTIAPCGGYVAGKRIWVEAAAARLSAPGLGVDCGSMTGDVRRALFQGLFLSPQMVGEAIKAVQLGGRERLISFCEAVQRSCPIGSYIKPTAGVTTGYASEV
ncbi:hypothetical protein BHM03_00057069 [Ensete ventricosum]|nr:hypothetical protein BHM03_00057069 [Ensete ventricosum]